MPCLKHPLINTMLNSMDLLLYLKLSEEETGWQKAVENASKWLVHPTLEATMSKLSSSWKVPTTAHQVTHLAMERLILISLLQVSITQMLVSQMYVIASKSKLSTHPKLVHTGWSTVKTQMKIAIVMLSKTKHWRMVAITSSHLTGTTPQFLTRNCHIAHQSWITVLHAGKIMVNNGLFKPLLSALILLPLLLLMSLKTKR